MEAVFEEALVEVDEEGEAELHELEISQNLGGADWMNFLDRFDFAKDSAGD
jgi:hypothetical protein